MRLAPIYELRTLREESLLDVADVTPAVAAARLAGVQGDLLEVELELAPAAGNDARRGLVLPVAPHRADPVGIRPESRDRPADSPMK